jgi:LPXTG-motif cell wall-anchored protein
VIEAIGTYVLSAAGLLAILLAFAALWLRRVRRERARARFFRSLGVRG